MPGLDLHAAVEVRFVHRSSEINRFQDARQKGVVDCRWVCSFQAFENAPVDLRCRYFAALLERQRRVFRGSGGNQPVQVADESVGNDVGYLQFGRKQSDNFLAWRLAEKDASILIVKEVSDVGVDFVNARPVPRSRPDRMP